MHISAFGAALRTPDLRKKIFFTIGLLALYRLGSVVPTPGVDYAAIQGHVAAATPVPGGVGPMTVAMLLHNTLTSHARATEVQP